MIQVPVAEARLLTLARFALGFAEEYQVLPTLLTRQATVAQLTPAGAEALKDTLSRGTVHALAQGGWKKLGTQRLWERVKPPAMEFTPAIFQVLNWLLFAPLSADQVMTLPRVSFTPAEDFFFAQFILRQRDGRVRKNLLRQPSFQLAPLTRLMHGAQMSLASGETLAPVEIDLEKYAVFLEASQDLMAGTWFTGELLKRTARVPAVLRAMGETQTQALQQLMKRADAAGRRDLMTFALEAAHQFFAGNRTVDDLVGPLDPAATLKERSGARQAAGALMNAVTAIQLWDEAHKTVHFVDDAYAQAQQLLKLWAPYRESTFTKAARVADQLTQLPT